MSDTCTWAKCTRVGVCKVYQKALGRQFCAPHCILHRESMGLDNLCGFCDRGLLSPPPTAEVRHAPWLEQQQLRFELSPQHVGLGNFAKQRVTPHQPTASAQHELPSSAVEHYQRGARRMEPVYQNAAQTAQYPAQQPAWEPQGHSSSAGRSPLQDHRDTNAQSRSDRPAVPSQQSLERASLAQGQQLPYRGAHAEQRGADAYEQPPPPLPKSLVAERPQRPQRPLKPALRAPARQEFHLPPRPRQQSRYDDQSSLLRSPATKPPVTIQLDALQAEARSAQSGSQLPTPTNSAPTREGQTRPVVRSGGKGPRRPREQLPFTTTPLSPLKSEGPIVGYEEPRNQNTRLYTQQEGQQQPATGPKPLPQQKLQCQSQPAALEESARRADIVVDSSSSDRSPQTDKAKWNPPPTSSIPAQPTEIQLSHLISNTETSTEHPPHPTSSSSSDRSTTANSARHSRTAVFRKKQPQSPEPRKGLNTNRAPSPLADDDRSATESVVLAHPDTAITSINTASSHESDLEINRHSDPPSSESLAGSVFETNPTHSPVHGGVLTDDSFSTSSRSSEPRILTNGLLERLEAAALRMLYDDEAHFSGEYRAIVENLPAHCLDDGKTSTDLELDIFGNPRPDAARTHEPAAAQLVRNAYGKSDIRSDSKDVHARMPVDGMHARVTGSGEGSRTATERDTTGEGHEVPSARTNFHPSHGRTSGSASPVGDALPASGDASTRSFYNVHTDRVEQMPYCSPSCFSKNRKHVYAVYVGRKPGIYGTFPEMQEQTLGFTHARMAKFRSVDDAVTLFESERKKGKRPAPVTRT